MHIVLFIALVLIVILGPGIWVRHVLSTYSQPDDRYSRSGAAIARHLLDNNDLNTVKVETTERGDHYDPIAKAVRLSTENHDGRSLTAITVAAHEVGHALQDRAKYAPLRWRTRLVRAMGGIEKLGAGVLVVAPFLAVITRVPALGLISFAAGFLALGSSAVVHLITLPTEFDASFNRALPMLEKMNILRQPDAPHARRILRAAALTYVSVSLMSLLNIARWLAILRR